jgi:hypothetical protein
LIEEKVADNIRRSEAAAQALVRMQEERSKARKARKGGDYEELRQKWESEFEEKAAAVKAARENRSASVVYDFEKRKW